MNGPMKSRRELEVSSRHSGLSADGRTQSYAWCDGCHQSACRGLACCDWNITHARCEHALRRYATKCSTVRCAPSAGALRCQTDIRARLSQEGTTHTRCAAPQTPGESTMAPPRTQSIILAALIYNLTQLRENSSLPSLQPPHVSSRALTNLAMTDSSLSHNPPNAARHITAGGTDWLWAVFAVMALSALGMIMWSFTRPRGTRLFHHLATIILTTSTIAYLAMASDLGATPITTEFGTPPVTRQIWYVRYIQWFINFPLLLLILLFSTGLALSDILTTAFFAWVVVVCGLVGALVASDYKWAFFVIGVVALMYIWAVLLFHGPRTTFNAGGGVRSGFMRGAGFVAFVTMLYPIAWGCSEGGNVISPTGEMIWYGILDLILGPLFLYYFVWGLRNVDYGLFGFHSGKYTDGAYGTSGAAPGINTTAPNMAASRV